MSDYLYDGRAKDHAAQAHWDARAEAVGCQLCGVIVHPDNLQRHYEMEHPDEEELHTLRGETALAVPERHEIRQLTPDELVGLTDEWHKSTLALFENPPDIFSQVDQKARLEAAGKYLLHLLKGQETRKAAKDNITHDMILREIAASRTADQMQDDGVMATREKNPGQYGSNTMLDPLDDLLTAADIGITHMQLSRWRMMAALPDDIREAFIAEIKESPKELTRGAVLAYAKRYLAKHTVVPLPDGVFRVIYADPPWQYGNTMPDGFGEQGDHYPLMSIEEICALPVEDIVADDAVLFLWATSPILEDAFKVIRAWGFTYKASFVWDKVKHVMGHYNSVRHEFLLVAIRGSCQPDEQKLFDSVVVEERSAHSRKPEVFRQMIDTLYTHGSRIELFARHLVDGWEAHGNQIPGQ